MRNLFFYGTLRDLPLLEIVMGRGGDDLDVTAAVLRDYKVSSVAQGPFPMIEHTPGAEAIGVLVRGLMPEDIARLDFYEGSFAYDLVAVTLADGQAAEVYLPQAGLWRPQGDWSLSQWQAEWGDLSRFAAREVMGYMGQRSRDEVAALFGRIRARAAAMVQAQASQHGAGTFHGAVKVFDHKRVYSKFYALDEMRLQFEKFDGSLSAPVERAVFVGTDAAIVLPYDPVRDRVLLIEQIRMGPLVRGDKSLWQLEPIAGGIDPGESPETAARREAMEEAGLALGALVPIAQVYASPGNASEFYYIFLGLADLPDDITGTGGLEGEAEDIRSHVMGFADLMALVDGIHAANAPLVLSAYWLARHRDGLRLANAGDTPDKR
ncbi:MAG: nudix-type nucleoside diphosphatase (YffH/AdpP family) [Sulfitobacter sp.]|jgi:ADP-ribose diphosphatase